jgi:hypothetical protein
MAVEFHIALSAVSIGYFLFGDGYISQATAVAAGTTQLIVLLTSKIVNPVLCHRSQKQMAIAKLSPAQAKDPWTAWAVARAKFHLSVAFNCAWRLTLLMLTIVPILIGARWIRHSGVFPSVLVIAPAMFVFGGVARKLTAAFLSDTTMNQPSGPTPVDQDVDALYGDNEERTPYTQDFWSNGLEALEDQQVMLEPVDLLAGVYLSLL